MKLITTERQLLSYIPNSIVSVKGEKSFLERVATFIDIAEVWASDNFTGGKIFDEVCDDGISDLHQSLSALVVTDAMRRAVPSLDVVLSPNGFAVVNTANLAPASKPRVDRLVESLTDLRDARISDLLQRLVCMTSWLSTPQSGFFGATLFPDLSVVDTVGGCQGSRWDKYLELRTQIIDIEASLADEWFSPQLMAALHSENLRHTLQGKRIHVAMQIKAQIVEVLKGNLRPRRMADIVNVIRDDSDTFPEWHSSPTAELFSPPVFRNEKKSSGYFF